MEEVKAVGSCGVSGTGRKLPPPLGAIVGFGEVEQAGEVQGAFDVGGLLGEPGQVGGSVVAVQELSGQVVKVFVGAVQHGREAPFGSQPAAEHEGGGDIAYDLLLQVGDVFVGERIGQGCLRSDYLAATRPRPTA
ncbi:hypothetical protein [Streptomyces sp. NK08204]|uniref:hypothetical protein n=1 Tax=Streptomyces sp. NK08204 TaxID=2873260 RepID=UPI001CEDF761|nr:hypothetical protein [Streptomyces sp. NK08204]